jgi:hypothetical protein
MSSKFAHFKCSKCGQTVCYSVGNFRKSIIYNQLKCRATCCDYILTKEEQEKIEKELCLKGILH